jgi:hypothetical protein
MTTYGDRPWYALDGWLGNATDDYGCQWVITGEDGWGSAAPARAAVAEREADDGGIDAPTYEGPRVITLEGTCIAPNKLEQNAAKDRLNAVAYTSRDLYPLVVTETHLERTALVRRSGGAKVADKGPVAFEFSLALVAPDPRKYALDAASVDVSLAGSVAVVGRTYPRTYPKTYGTAGATSTPSATITNVGNRDTGAVITLTGGIYRPGVMHVGTGAALRFDITMLDTDQLVIDLLNRTAVLNGTVSRRSSLMVGSAWFLVPPGASQVRMLGTSTGSTGAAMNVTYHSAWK